ncbi:MAG: aconitase family protein, partial [Bacillota bacterium]
GSRQVLQMVAQNGALADIVSAGARVLESTCGFCIGNGQAPQTNAVSIRTSNRNFEGRSGTRSAKVYLTSPETAVASALAGELVDPTEWFANEEYPSYERPKQVLVDDSMILRPADNPDQVEIYRGPNIGEPPSNDPLPETIDGEVAIKVGDKITTDHIMPAGSRLKYRSNVAKYSTFVFEGVDPTFAERAAANRDKGIHNIIVAGVSYGQGSSREHAALCPMYLGVKAVIAKSMERIHRANLINFGIVPLLFADSEDYDELTQGDRLEIDNIREQLLSGATRLTVRNATRNSTFEVNCDLTERERKIVAAGGLLNYTSQTGM